MPTAPNTLTPEEYLRLERASDEKHEYADGQMFAMAGANRKHRLITANIYIALRAKETESGCVSDTSDALLARLISLLENGQNIGIHCRQSVGRSGLIAAGILVSAGLDAEKAVVAVSVARGQPIPETSGQLEWIRHLPAYRTTTCVS